MPTQSIEIKCSNQKCKTWFPSSIFIGDMSSFDSATIVGNMAQCPKCHQITDCNKENMRVRSDDDGF